MNGRPARGDVKATATIPAGSAAPSPSDHLTTAGAVVAAAAVAVVVVSSGMGGPSGSPSPDREVRHSLEAKADQQTEHRDITPRPDSEPIEAPGRHDVARETYRIGLAHETERESTASCHGLGVAWSEGMTRRGSEDAERALSTIRLIAQCRYRNALASREAGQRWAAPDATTRMYRDLHHQAVLHRAQRRGRAVSRQGHQAGARASRVGDLDDPHDGIGGRSSSAAPGVRHAG